jgi:hypothetical protein
MERKREMEQRITENPRIAVRRVLKKIYQIIIRTVKALVLTVPFLFGIAYVNYTVDPGRLYHTDREDMLEYDIVRMLLEGSNVDNLSSYDERLTRRDYVNRMEQAVGVIVAGSSRSALITKEMLGVESMFNVSVASGELEDIIGFYGVLHKYHKLPKRIILAIDPWMLNDNYNDGRFAAALGDGYYYYVAERMGWQANPELKQVSELYLPGSTQSISFWELEEDVKLNLFSVTYFQSAIQTQLGSIEKKRTDDWPYPTDDYYGEFGMLRPDGSFSYPKSYREVSAEEAHIRAVMSLPHNIRGLEDYTEQESESKRLFMDFVRGVKSDGVKVEILIEPISSTLYEYMQEFPDHYKNFFMADELMKEIAEELDVRLVGSFYPDVYGLTMEDFYDGYHLRSAEVERVVAPLKETKSI